MIWGLTIIFTVIAAILAPFLATISGVTDFRSFREQWQQWDLVCAFPPAQEGETLIAIATFEYTEGNTDTKAQDGILKAIEQAKTDLGMKGLRAQVSPVHLAADDRYGAERIGKNVMHP